MKAQIKYTIDFEDIPREVDMLLNRATAYAHDAQLILGDIKTNETGNSLDDSISAIDEARQQLSRSDALLADCDAILRGFMATKHNFAELTQDGDTE